MKNIGVWIITAIIAILLVVGIYYYQIFGAIENMGSFIITLVVIFLGLFFVIFFAIKKKNRNQKPSVKKEESKVTKTKVSKK